jgi:hypothetical protein
MYSYIAKMVTDCKTIKCYSREKYGFPRARGKWQYEKSEKSEERQINEAILKIEKNGIIETNSKKEYEVIEEEELTVPNEDEDEVIEEELTTLNEDEDEVIEEELTTLNENEDEVIEEELTTLNEDENVDTKEEMLSSNHDLIFGMKHLNLNKIEPIGELEQSMKSFNIHDLPPPPKIIKRPNITFNNNNPAKRPKIVVYDSIQKTTTPTVSTDVKISKVPKQVIKEVPKQVVREVPKQVVKEVPKQVVKEVPKQVVKEVPKQVVKEVPKQVVREVPKESIFHGVTPFYDESISRRTPQTSNPFENVSYKTTKDVEMVDESGIDDKFIDNPFGKWAFKGQVYRNLKK